MDAGVDVVVLVDPEELEDELDALDELLPDVVVAVLVVLFVDFFLVVFFVLFLVLDVVVVAGVVLVLVVVVEGVAVVVVDCELVVELDPVVPELVVVEPESEAPVDKVSPPDEPNCGGVIDSTAPSPATVPPEISRKRLLTI